MSAQPEEHSNAKFATIHYVKPTYLQIEFSNNIHEKISEFARGEILSNSSIIIAREFDPSIDIPNENIHAIVLMATNDMIPLLRDAQDQVVKSAWAPYIWVDSSFKEMYHKRVMDVMRMKEASSQRIRHVEGIAQDLLERFEGLK